MEEGKCYIGLEIGSSKVAAIAGLHEKGKIKVLGYSERQILPGDEIIQFGNVVNAQITSDLIGDVLDEMAGEFDKTGHEFELNTVNINIANLSIQSTVKNTKVVTSGGTNRVSQQDVNRLLTDAYNAYKVSDGNVVLHCLPRDFSVNDHKTIGTLVGKIGNELSGDITFITSKTENMQHLLECVNQVPTKGTSSGYLNVENILLNSVADSCSLLNNSSEDPDTKKDGVAIINIGAEMTQICVYHNNSLRHHSILPVAGNSINSDLEKAFGITFSDAEYLKKICGKIPPLSYEDSPVILIERKGGMPPREVFLKNATTVVEWRLREIATLVDAELKKSGLKSQLLNGIILTGGSSLFSNIKEIFTTACKNVSVRTTEFSSSINFNNFKELKNPKYSTLLGLIVAPAFKFDSRVENSVLTPKAITNLTPQPKEVGAAKGGKTSDWTAHIKGFFKRPPNDLNDNY